MEMNKKQIGGAIIAAVLFILIGISSVITNKVASNVLEESTEKVVANGMQIALPYEPYIGIVEVFGTIQVQAETSAFSKAEGYQHSSTLQYIDMMIADKKNKGLLLHVDSPGGAVYESEELYLKLEEYKATDRPIWTYMGHYAASGGYYVAALSDEIYANPNTTTGSIGVIISTTDLSGLYEKLGIKQINIVSGNNKASDLNNPEQVAMYQSVVDEAYERFVEIVVKGRGMTEEKVKVLADGRVYTAKQAKENGLIDEIALYEETTAAMQKELNNKTFYVPSMKHSPIAGLFSKLGNLVPKSEAEILAELAEKEGSGVPMYYAQQ